ncbi:MAG: hypothetical protein LC674_07115 [Actinobacteria bacterium]|nr:hypothetical protein [Actinomycetota bacterium]
MSSNADGVCGLGVKPDRGHGGDVLMAKITALVSRRRRSDVVVGDGNSARGASCRPSGEAHPAAGRWTAFERKKIRP